MVQNDKKNTFGQIPISDSAKPDENQHSHSEPPSFSRQTIKPKNQFSFRLKLIIFFLLSGFLFYLGAGFFLFPYLLKTSGATLLAERLGRSVTIGQAEFNPLKLKLSLSNSIIGPKLSEPDDPIDPLLSFSNLRVDFELTSAFHGALICKEFTLSQPFVHLTRDKNGTFNIFSLFNDAKTEKDSQEKITFSPPKYSINSIKLTGGEITFDDFSTNKTHEVKDISIILPSLANISTQPPNLIPSFSAIINGSRIKMTGQANAATGALETRFALKMNAVNLASYSSYLPQEYFREVTGAADLDLEMIYATGKKIPDQQLQLAGKIMLHDVAFKDINENAAKIANAEIEGWLSPLTGKFKLNTIQLTGPHLTYKSGENIKPVTLDSFLTSDIGERLILQSGGLQIINGTITNQKSEKNVPVKQWQNVNITVSPSKNVTSPLPENLHKDFIISSKGPDGLKLNFEGNITPSPLSVKGLFVADHMTSDHLKAYLKKTDLPSLSKGSIEKLQAEFSYSAQNNTTLLSLKNMSIHAKDLLVGKKHTTPADISLWRSTYGSYESNTRTFNLGKVELEKAQLNIIRDKKDKWKFLTIPRPGDKNKTTHTTINSLNIVNSNLNITDKNWPDPVKVSLNSLNIELNNFSSGDKKIPFKGSASINRTYPIKLIGNYSLYPFNAELDLSLDDIPLSIIKPITNYYFSGDINASISTKGKLALPSFSYSGAINLDQLKYGNNQSVIPFIQWNKASSDTIKFSSSPYSLKVNNLYIDAPVLFYDLLEDETLNLFTPKKTEDSTFFSIDNITFKNGRIRLSNPRVSPEFTLETEGTEGKIPQITNAKDSKVEVSIAGQTKESKSPFFVKGFFSPFADQVDIQLNYQIAGLPVKKVSTYLEPYFGYKINNGNIDLNSSIQSQNNFIKFENEIISTGLSLGKKLPSNKIHAIGSSWESLPLLHALLEDSNKQIIVSLPFEKNTRTNDISFSKSLQKILHQLLLKAAVSPFSLLESPGSQRDFPDNTLFLPGSDTVAEQDKEKLIKLAKAVKNHPLLLIRMSGHADNKLDRKVFVDIRAKEIERLQHERQANLSRSLSNSYGSEIIIQPSEKNIVASQAETKKRIESIVISDQLLLELATSRSDNIKNILLGTGLDQSQIVVDKPTIITSSPLGRTSSRVNLKLEKK